MMDIHTLARQAIIGYDQIPRKASLHFLRHNENAVFQVRMEDRPTHVLRLHVPNPALGEGALSHNPQWLEAEMAFLQALHEGSGLSVQQPVPARDGELMITLPNGAGYATLLSWLPGEPLSPDAPDAAMLAREAGRLAAKLHGFVRSHPSLSLLQRPSYDAARMQAVAVRLHEGVRSGFFSQEVYRDLAACARQIGAAMEAEKQQEGAYGLTHSDLGLGNLLVYHGMVSPIDFSLCGFSPFLFDVGGMLAAFNEPRLRVQILEGYAQTRPLSLRDNRVIEACYLAGIFLFMGLHLHNRRTSEWFGRGLPAVADAYILPFLREEPFLPQLLAPPYA